MMEKQVEMLE